MTGDALFDEEASSILGRPGESSVAAPRDGSDRSNVQTIGTIEEDNAHNLTAAASHSNVRRAAEEEEKTD